MIRPQIISDARIMQGKPVIAGTRITVELLLEKMAAGETAEQIYQAHPQLPPASLEAAISYAATLVRNETVVPHGLPVS
jgi:uncharacterized protein (DUF433 family)